MTISPSRPVGHSRVRHRPGLVLAVVLIALAFGLWWMFGRTDKLPDTIVRGNGRLEMTRTDIAAKYPGRLMSLDVHEGDLVGAGQVIARQDDVDLKAQLAGALAKREQAVSALMRAQGELAALAEALAALDRAILEGTEAEEKLEEAAEALVHDPAALDAAETRLFDLRALARKHRCEVDELPDKMREMRSQLDAIEGGEAQLDALRIAEREAELNALVLEHASDHQRLAEISAELGELSAEKDEVEMEWLGAAEALE